MLCIYLGLTVNSPVTFVNDITSEGHPTLSVQEIISICGVINPVNRILYDIVTNPQKND